MDSAGHVEDSGDSGKKGMMDTMGNLDKTGTMDKKGSLGTMGMTGKKESLLLPYKLHCSSNLFVDIQIISPDSHTLHLSKPRLLSKKIL